MPAFRIGRLTLVAVLSTLPLWGIVPSAIADVVHLKSGEKLEGDVKRGDGGYIITHADGKTTRVEIRDVKSIELRGAAKTSPESLEHRLEGLRRFARMQSDIDLIMLRYQQFINAHQNSDAAKLAAQDLDLWKQRKTDGLVKAGDDWVTGDELFRRRAEAIEKARDVLRSLKENRLAEAQRGLVETFKLDPNSPSGHYLTGLLQARQDKWFDARRAFERANAALPGNAAILNNIGVSFARMKQTGAAVRAYAQALATDPESRVVLNNVAEFLNAYPDAQFKRNPAAKRLLEQFRSADLKLQQKLRPAGIYRWGSSWVNERQLAELRKVEQKINAEIAELEARFGKLKAELAGVREELQFKEDRLDSLERSRWIRLSDGRLLKRELPAVYYDVLREVGFLRGKRKALEVQIDQLRDQARMVKRSLPTPPFTGIQRLIEEEGTPLKLPKPPIKQTPSTQPTG